MKAFLARLVRLWIESAEQRGWLEQADLDDDPWCHKHNRPATTERVTDISDHAVDEDGYSWEVHLICEECA